jgi:hypothetical protein
MKLSQESLAYKQKTRHSKEAHEPNQGYIPPTYFLLDNIAIEAKRTLRLESIQERAV